MTCSNQFCIYQEANTCILDEISLNESGICEDSITIDVPERILKLMKQHLLERLDDDFKELEDSIEKIIKILHQND